MESYILAYYLRTYVEHVSRSLPQLEHGLRGFSWLLIIIVPAWVAALESVGLYDASNYKSTPRLARALCKAQLLASLMLFSAVFALRQYAVSRTLLTGFVAVSFVSLMVEKIAVRMTIGYRAKRRHDAWRVLVVGERNDAQTYLDLVREHPDWNIEIVGVLEPAERRAEERANGHHNPR